MTFAIPTPRASQALSRSFHRLSHIALAATVGVAVAVGATLAITDTDAPKAGGRVGTTTSVAYVDESLGILASDANANRMAGINDTLQFGMTGAGSSAGPAAGTVDMLHFGLAS